MEGIWLAWREDFKQAERAKKTLASENKHPTQLLATEGKHHFQLLAADGKHPSQHSW